MLWSAGGCCGCEHTCLAVGHQHGTVGLTCDTPGFHGERATAPFDFFLGYRKHTFVLSFVCTLADSGVPLGSAMRFAFDGPDVFKATVM